MVSRWQAHSFSSARFGFKDEAPLYHDVPQPYAELFVMNADGSGQRPLTDNQWEDGTPAGHPHPCPSFQVKYAMQFKDRQFRRGPA